MLSNISNGLASLAAAEFQGYNFDKTEISKFIFKNPQLKKLEISTGHLNEDVISSILNLERLNQLYIKDSSWNNENELNISAENYSIKHFKYTGNGYNMNIVRIISLCKSLEVFEICDIAVLSSFVNTANNSFTEISTLLIASSFDIYSIELLLKLKKFDQIKFRGVCKFIELYNKIKRLKNCNWKSKCDYSIDTDEFTLIRKLK
ncbi:hypothetical protein CONCODRAFT_5028 [Conidiobolus coronatus NRRL 28638]|uniref:RNI-like protein n=1 Tax=Conidiobolus coronatus (strain ATCC 28846 / CBS 209.66 / NRRL 28638) TaxID=796925 RepID=A0A137PAZ4_CONC2|nr:hypothetical protein CONCODRAFT_5028 [Conidiobolus coronatus NRRL 28638]|eukprot:KXN72190.1 hypothetical protein CONCODRAFT_5028 [Conidiobolus coronatus NRRL 28638]